MCRVGPQEDFAELFSRFLAQFIVSVVDSLQCPLLSQAPQQLAHRFVLQPIAGQAQLLQVVCRERVEVGAERVAHTLAQEVPVQGQLFLRHVRW